MIIDYERNIFPSWQDNNGKKSNSAGTRSVGLGYSKTVKEGIYQKDWKEESDLSGDSYRV